jgi:hypothetical protein
VERDFLEMMPFTVTVRPHTGQRDRTGKPIFGAARTPKCYIEGRIQTVKNASGQEEVSSEAVYLFDVTPVSNEDEVTMPDGRKPGIITILSLADEKGAYGVVLYM